MVYNEEQLKDRHCKNIDVVCEQCKKEFQCVRRVLQQSLRDNIIKYCSITCSGLAFRKPRLEFNCKRCGISFTRLESANSKSKEYFCSQKCSAEFNNDKRWNEKVSNGEASFIICKWCNTQTYCNPSLIGRKKFCSMTCKVNFQYGPIIKEKIEDGLIKTGRYTELYKRCPACNEEFSVTPYMYDKRKFCSGKCRNHENNKLLCGKVSKAEKLLRIAIETRFLGECVIFNDRKILNGLELDVYFPDLKFAIEWNGIYHFKDIRGDKSLDNVRIKDTTKITKCAELGIDLMVIEDLTSSKKFIEENINKSILHIEKLISNRKLV